MRDEKVTINAPVNGDIRRTPIDVNANSAERGEIENFLPDKINREWAAIIKSSPSHFQPIGRKGRLDGSKSIKRDLFLARSSDTDIPDSHENLSFSDSSSGVPEMWFRAGPPLGSGGRFDGDGAIFSEGKGDDIFSGPEVNHILRRRRRSSRLRKKERTLYRISSSPFCISKEQKMQKNGTHWAGFSEEDAEDRRIGDVKAKEKHPHSPLTFEQVSWGEICGLETHLSTLQELVIWPLRYPHIFERLGIGTAKGILFHGPPGTGKTMVARALATLISENSPHCKRKVAFFSRSSSELLSKWIGEAEKGLRSLFQQAKASAPSIIFFDEMDGLAPRRSAKQDQSHISLVSMLLTLMDGLETRGNVVIIAATNRIDAIDPALRRPGRFDRELYFGLPTASMRREMIMRGMSRCNSSEIDKGLVDGIVIQTEGLSFAELKALCIESVYGSLRRVGGDAWLSAQDASCGDLSLLKQEPIDWLQALKVVTSRLRGAESETTIISAQSELGLHSKAFRILDEILCNRIALVLADDDSGADLSATLSSWASAMPLRMGKLVRVISLDIYTLYAVNEGDFGNITPENRLVSILGMALKNHGSMSTEEESITVFFLPYVERWRTAMQGTRCWAIFKHFTLMISGSQKKIHLLFSSSRKKYFHGADDKHPLEHVVNLKKLWFDDEN